MPGIGLEPKDNKNIIQGNTFRPITSMVAADYDQLQADLADSHDRVEELESDMKLAREYLAQLEAQVASLQQQLAERS